MTWSSIDFANLASRATNTSGDGPNGHSASRSRIIASATSNARVRIRAAEALTFARNCCRAFTSVRRKIAAGDSSCCEWGMPPRWIIARSADSRSFRFTRSTSESRRFFSNPCNAASTAFSSSSRARRTSSSHAVRAASTCARATSTGSAGATASTGSCAAAHAVSVAI